jgi:hypothetical protein
MLQLALLSSLLLTQADAPVANTMTPEQVREPVGWGYQYAAGAAVAIVAVPTSIYLGSWLGSLSNDLYASAIPVLLSIGLIPPLAITAITVLVGNWNTKGRYRWWPAFLATMVINGGSLAIAAWGGLSQLIVGRVIVYTLAQAVLQPGAAVLLERAWPKSEPTVIMTPSDPVAPRTFMVPTGTWSF